MTPAQLAALHNIAFQTDRPWSAAEFADLIQSTFVHIIPHAHGFALTRTVAGESELLTLAVDPAFQRQGIGHALTRAWLEAIADTAQSAFLEVAADNVGARALYAKLGFDVVATRPVYYTRKNAAHVDAIVMRRDLT